MKSWAIESNKNHDHHFSYLWSSSSGKLITAAEELMRRRQAYLRTCLFKNTFSCKKYVLMANAENNNTLQFLFLFVLICVVFVILWITFHWLPPFGVFVFYQYPLFCPVFVFLLVWEMVGCILNADLLMRSAHAESDLWVIVIERKEEKGGKEKKTIFYSVLLIMLFLEILNIFFTTENSMKFHKIVMVMLDFFKTFQTDLLPISQN